ncbi:MAG: carbohydrate ABC transporter permease [Burkholderiales bacterium]|nr:MAG: carbohydrate ABC transporter permease [Burkholderiales bacterium]
MNGLAFALFRHAVLLGLAALVLLPFAWMVATSLKPPSEIFVDHVRWWPDTLYVVENYTAAFTKAPLLRFLFNGVVVTASIFVIQVVVAMPTAYALAKLRFAGREVLFAVVLLCLLIPSHAVAVPVFLLLHALGLLNSYAALVLPWTISVFGIFLMRQFFMTVPDDLVDAARMDGLSEFAIVWRVMLPTAVPALTAFGIFSVVAHWNDYFWPLIVINDQALFTPPLGVAHFRNEDAGTDFGPLMAAATVIIAPLIAGFLLAQRRFVQGIALTGMK